MGIPKTGAGLADLIGIDLMVDVVASLRPLCLRQMPRRWWWN